MRWSPAKTAALFCAIIGFFWAGAAMAVTITCKPSSPCNVNLQPPKITGTLFAGPLDKEINAGDSLDWEGGHAKLSETDSPTPTITATASASGKNDQADSASGTLTYQATVVPITALAPLQSVEVEVTGTLSVDGSSNGKGDGFFASDEAAFAVVHAIDVPDELNKQLLLQCSGPFGPSCGAHPFAVTGFVGPEGIINVFLQVAAQSKHQPDGTENAVATIDPSIFIDPSFPDADMYEVVVSPGIGNALGPSSVPEPATWAMMSIGFAGLGFAGWRAKRKSSVLPA